MAVDEVGAKIQHTRLSNTTNSQGCDHRIGVFENRYNWINVGPANAGSRSTIGSLRSQ